jgi:hypothetical protein
MVSAFEGNKAETKTMLPVIESFMAAHDLPQRPSTTSMPLDAGKERVRARVQLRLPRMTWRKLTATTTATGRDHRRAPATIRVLVMPQDLVILVAAE